MSKVDVKCNVVVHARMVDYDGKMTRIEVAASNLQELEDIMISLGEDGASILYIEDKDYSPVVDKWITVMRRTGLSFVTPNGVHYYYIGPIPYKYKGDGPSATDGDHISEEEMRVAVQSHIQSLSGEDREVELSYIERRYNEVTGSNALLGQTSIYDYIEEE